MNIIEIHIIKINKNLLVPGNFGPLLPLFDVQARKYFLSVNPLLDIFDIYACVCLHEREFSTLVQGFLPQNVFPLQKYGLPFFNEMKILLKKNTQFHSFLLIRILQIKIYIFVLLEN